jgi:hypothetical protein
LLKEVFYLKMTSKLRTVERIMGMGNSKNPIVSQLSENVYCGVRLGGMGVAIGSLIEQISRFSIMATKISTKKRQPVKRTNLFYEQATRFLFKVLLWFFGLCFVVLFKFVPVPFTPLMVIQAIENKVGGKEVFLVMIGNPLRTSR